MSEKDDEQPLVIRDGALMVRAINEKARTIDFVASTETIDSYDEIVEQSWDLERYRSNPVVLYAHNSRALPIGKALKCDVVNDISGPRLECTLEFATAEMNPEADNVFRLLVGNFLRAVSVGFRPKNIRYEKRNGNDVYILSDNVLHEISVVTIPANPDALAKGQKDPLAAMKAKALADAQDTTREGAPDPRAAAFAQAKADALANPTTTPSTTGGQENVMNEKEMKAALDAKIGELAIANEKAAEAARQAEKALAEKAEAEKLAAEASTRATAALENTEKLLSVVNGAKDLVDKTFTILGRKPKLDEKGEPLLNEKGEPVLETLLEVAERVIGEIIERDVDALIPSKLTPGQKDDFVALAKANRASFDKIVAGLPDLKLTGQVIPPANKETGTQSPTGGPDGDLGALLDLDEEGGEKASTEDDLGDLLNDD